MSRLRDLSQWSARKVIAACALWLVGAPVAIALGLVLAGLILAKLSGKTSIALRAQITNLSLGWLFLPPVLLVGAWIVARSRAGHSASRRGEADRATLLD